MAGEVWLMQWYIRCDDGDQKVGGHMSERFGGILMMDIVRPEYRTESLHAIRVSVVHCTHDEMLRLDDVRTYSYCLSCYSRD